MEVDESSSDEEMDYKNIAEAIQENDPEHYKFLLKNDPQLLHADVSEDESLDGESENEEEEEEENMEEEAPKAKVETKAF